MEKPVGAAGGKALRVAGVVLAAGRSARMGRNKLLLRYRGRPLVSYGLLALAGAGVSPVVCVLGFEADAVRRALESGPTASLASSVRFVVNPDHATGRASSLRVGLDALGDGCDASIFMPGDMPEISAGHVAALMERYRTTKAPIVVAVGPAGERSHPVLFAREMFDRLRSLSGDESGQGILLDGWEAAEKVPTGASVPLDVDTEDDYRRLRQA